MTRVKGVAVLFAGQGFNRPDEATANPCFQHFGCADLFGAGCHRIGIDQNEIGTQAGGEASEVLFGKAGICSVAGVGGKGGDAINALLGLPAACGLAIGALASDGGGKTGPWIGLFHRRV